MKRIGAVIVVVASLVSACGGGDTAPEVALEARWQCDVQRQTFDDIAALDAELESRLAEAEMSSADYDAFKEKLAGSPDLRVEVAQEYDAYCLP